MKSCFNCIFSQYRQSSMQDTALMCRHAAGVAQNDPHHGECAPAGIAGKTSTRPLELAKRCKRYVDKRNDALSVRVA